MPRGYCGRRRFKFRLQLSLHGESVRGVAGDSNLTGSGTFRERKLTLTLKNENGTFILQGDLDNANLTGSRRKEDDSLQGTWSAVPVDTTPAEWQSPALVSLREYRRLVDGGSDDPCNPNRRRVVSKSGESFVASGKRPIQCWRWIGKPNPFQRHSNSAGRGDVRPVHVKCSCAAA